jgi:hypothetical protein
MPNYDTLAAILINLAGKLTPKVFFTIVAVTMIWPGMCL